MIIVSAYDNERGRYVIEISTGDKQLFVRDRLKGGTMFRQKFLTMTLLVVILFSQFIPHASAAGVCDWAKFIADVTVTDGTYFPAGAPFVRLS